MGCLIVFMFPIIVVTMAQISEAVRCCISFVANINIVATSKSWTAVFVVINCIFRFGAFEFLFLGQRENETSRFISIKTLSRRRPFCRIEPTNNFPELSFNENDRIRNPITERMELGSRELIL